MKGALCLALFLAVSCGQPGDPSPDGDAALSTTQDISAFQTGADRLVASGFDGLAGLRVGLIANQTSTTGGRHLADLLHEEPSVTLAALFGPEHGLRGEADAGEGVADGIDDRTGVPVHSLYGERRAPAPEVLATLDLLVFDIQDIGARFYTYIATMGLAMEAAAQAGVPFLVLDRPNPLGGHMVDGFVLEEGFESFVGPFRIPVQHGLTVGELARMIQGEGWIEHASTLDLRVLEVTDWSRSSLWPEGGREWIPTSPNIPSFETALVYPGLCYVEATSASEGRGTDHPFLLVGAPGLSGLTLVERLAGVPGIAVSDTVFTPVSMPGKSTNPKHQDRSIPGIRLTVTDAKAVRPVALGMHVLVGLVDQLGADVLLESSMRRLAGTEAMYAALSQGTSAEAIIQAWESDLESFRTLRSAYLLYD